MKSNETEMISKEKKNVL